MDIEETVDDIEVLYRELLKLRGDFEALKREYDIMAKRFSAAEEWKLSRLTSDGWDGF